MMDKLRDGYRRIRAMKWLSPGSFVLCAATFAGLFALMHVAGWREQTSVFCGTLPRETGAQISQGFRAVCYTLFYLVTVIVAPILLLAAGIYQGLLVVLARRMR